MDKTIYQAHSYDAVFTTTRQAQCDFKMLAPTIKPEPVQCMDEEDTHHNDYMYPYKPLGSPNCVNYYDDQFCVSEEMKKEFPEDECSQSSTSVSRINECSINSKIVIKNEEPSKVVETQELHHENSEGAFSFIKTKEIRDKKNPFVAKPEMSEEHRTLDNAGVSGVLSKLRTTQEIQPKMCSGILKKRLNLLKHSNEHLQVEPPTAVGNVKNELGKCECCNEYFNNYGNMLAFADNVRSNEKLKSHKCHLCEHIHKCKTALVEDTKNIYHDSGKIFKCWCGKQFRTPTYLSRHKYRQHGRKVENTNNAAINKEFQCDICKKMCSTKGNLKIHITNIHYDYGKTFDCWCGKQFRTPRYLSIHEHSQHGPKVENTNNAALETDFQCDFCKRKFQTKSNLINHMRRIHYDYGKTFDCWCGKQFRTPKYLSDHKYRQHGSRVENTNNTALRKEFQCDICKKIFKSKEVLKIHLTSIHYDYGKTFDCWCGKQFRSSRYLSVHKYRQHGRKVEKTNNAALETNFQCDVCKRNFQKKSNLTKHIRNIHYDYGKRFECLCGKQFRTPSCLSNHKYRQYCSRVENTNNVDIKKECQCDICKKFFKSKYGLKAHVKGVHYNYGKTFDCWCGKQFRTPKNLCDHKNRKHGRKVENSNMPH